MSVNRYVNAIQAMLEIEQKKIEISRLTEVVKNNLTVAEYADNYPDINSIHLKLAFSRVTNGQINLEVENRISETFDSPAIIKASYVGSQIVYKDVSISLHCDVLGNPREALSHIIKEYK